MYARSITIVGNPGAVDDGIAYVRDEVMPGLMAMDGCAGMSLVVDRASGRAIVTSAWETMEAMEASNVALAPSRSRGGEVFGGEPSINLWEIALMHRDHATTEAACCRITWGSTPDVDMSVMKFKDDVLPLIEGAAGFCNASMFVDRASGRICGTVTFDSQDAMEATRPMAAERREMISQVTGMQFTDVAEFELVLAHLRVPELV